MIKRQNSAHNSLWKLTWSHLLQHTFTERGWPKANLTWLKATSIDSQGNHMSCQWAWGNELIPVILHPLQTAWESCGDCGHHIEIIYVKWTTRIDVGRYRQHTWQPGYHYDSRKCVTRSAGGISGSPELLWGQWCSNWQDHFGPLRCKALSLFPENMWSATVCQKPGYIQIVRGWRHQDSITSGAGILYATWRDILLWAMSTCGWLLDPRPNAGRLCESDDYSLLQWVHVGTLIGWDSGWMQIWLE